MYGHRVVLSFSPVVVVCLPPPFGSGGGGTLACGRKGGGSHFRRGDIHCGTLYKYVLCGRGMDEWTIKTPNPICRLFFQLIVNRLCGILLNRFYRVEIHSLMVCIFDPACELLPPWTKELYGTCVLLPIYCTFSLTSSPLPPHPNVQYIQTVCDWGGVEM